MSKAILLTVAISLCAYRLPAQSSSTLFGARGSGMGYTTSCLSDEWSLFNNIGGLAKVKESAVAFSYDAMPSFKPFNKAALVIAIPAKIGVWGIGLYRFGDNLYNEQIFTGGFSSSFGLASLGLRFNYIQYKVDGFGRKGILSLNIGGVAQLTPVLCVGAHIINVVQPKISNAQDEHIPTVLIVGLLFTPEKNILIGTELEKDLDYKPTWKTGIEYRIYKKFTFRTGFNIHPNAGFFGLGFKTSKFSFDYGHDFSLSIGGRHQATVGYKFKQSKKMNEK